MKVTNNDRCMYQPLRFFSGEVANGKVRSIFLSWSPSLLISLRIFVFLCCRQFVCLFFLRSKYQAYEKNTTITITFEFLISKVRIFFNLIQVKVSPSTNDISFLSLNILLYWTLACLFLSSFVVSVSGGCYLYSFHLGCSPDHWKR